MDNSLILLEIDQLHQLANNALSTGDISNYIKIFSEQLKYSYFDGLSVNKEQLNNKTKVYLKNNKDIHIEYYRLKSFYEEGILIEKLAKKVVSKKSQYFILSKKQTIQTEETFKWKEIDGIWQVIEVEISLEEKY